MAEVLRFRVARAPRNFDSTALDRVTYPRAKGSEDGAKPDRSAFKLTEPASFAKTAELVLANPTALEAQPNVDALFDVRLKDFTALLDGEVGRMKKEIIGAELIAWAKAAGPSVGAEPANPASRLVADARWAAMRVNVGDKLLAHMVKHPAGQALRDSTRQMQAAGVIEKLAQDPKLIDAPQKLTHLYVNSVVVVPADFAAPPPPATVTPPPKPVQFVRRPAFADQLVVQQEWSCYVPGEIADIENIMRGERKEWGVVTRNVTETTDTVSTSIKTTTEQEDSSTDSSSLSQEASRQTALDIGVDGQVDVGTQFGPMSIATSIGSSLNSSVQESQSTSTQQSKEIVSRSLARVESATRQRRTSRTLTSIRETQKHLFDNATNPIGHISGIYRWVDKVDRFQIFTYPHRFLLEFQVPDPAAFVRWVNDRKPKPHVTVDKPPPFTVDNKTDKKLKPEDITRENYGELAARFGATGLLPPPDRKKIVTVAKDLFTDTVLPTESSKPAGVVPTIASTIDLVVPDGYIAQSAVASFAAVPLLFKWQDQEKDNGKFEAADGYHFVKASIVMSGLTAHLKSHVEDTVRNTTPGEEHGLAYRFAWVQDTANFEFVAPADSVANQGGTRNIGEGKLSASVTAGGTSRCSISIRLDCDLKDSSFDKWRLQTFDQLFYAHQQEKSAYDQAVANAEAQQEFDAVERSPERNAETVREELKRQVIEQLMGETLSGTDVQVSPVDDKLGPVVNLKKVDNQADLVQFMEQVLEWDNMSFILYPYYWADRKEWKDLQPMEGSDPDYLRFLRSGSARVVVPARPGFEWPVLYYAMTQKTWLGNAPPTPNNPLYISVAAEIQHQMLAPQDGVPGDMWEAKQATDLLWLDPDGTLPQCNEMRQLVGTPAPDFCGPVCKPSAPR